MDANKTYHHGRHLTYSQYPSMFTYDSDGRFWRPRKRGGSVGRLTFVPHGNRDLFYLRLLLNVQVGCTSFEDVKTVKGRTYDSFREACGALKLLDDDREFVNSITEVAVLGSGFSIRKMFANLLMSNSMSDPLKVLEQLWETLCDGILYTRRKILKNPGWFVLMHFFFPSIIFFCLLTFMVFFFYNVNSHTIIFLFDQIWSYPQRISNNFACKRLILFFVKMEDVLIITNVCPNFLLPS
jgi:hypothetical protein